MTYRSCLRTLTEEEDLWFRLDGALYWALRDPKLAWDVAWAVILDSYAYPDVQRAAVELVEVLNGGGLPPDWDQPGPDA